MHPIDNHFAGITQYVIAGAGGKTAPSLWQEGLESQESESEFLPVMMGDGQVLPDRGKLLDDPSLFTFKYGPPSTINAQAAAVETTARFYHMTGSALTPVSSITSLGYDNFGCVHASAGAEYLLNAPLEISGGSLGDGGHSSNYGNLDHIVDTYNWRYVLNVRLNNEGSELQVCGLRVMYYAPA